MNTLKPFYTFIALLILFFSITIKSVAFGQNESDDEVDSETEERSLNKKSIEDENTLNAFKQLEISHGGVERSNIIHRRDQTTGLKTKYDISKDKGKISFSFHLNTNPYKFNHIISFDLNYSRLIHENFSMEGFFAISKNRFESISEKNASRTVSLEQMDETIETILTAGFGFSYKSSFIRDILRYDKFYETITGSIAVARMNENFLSENFWGPGVRADWGIHYRFSKYFHWGLKFSWNHYTVRRSEAFQDEPHAPRHLALNWLSLGFDWALYF